MNIKLINFEELCEFIILTLSMALWQSGRKPVFIRKSSSPGKSTDTSH